MRLVFLLLLLVGCATSNSPNKLSAFTTDGCSLYPDGIPLIQPNKWLHCCIAHDLSYWAGGSKSQKDLADHELGRCVAEQSSVNAKMMYQGVHVGGGANSVLPWAWGYGWRHNPGYNDHAAYEVEEILYRENTILKGISVYEKVLTERQMKYIMERVNAFESAVKTLNTP